MLCGFTAVLQASGFDCVAFDPFSVQQDGLAAPEVDVGWGQVAYALVVPKMAAPLDGICGGNCGAVPLSLAIIASVVNSPVFLVTSSSTWAGGDVRGGGAAVDFVRPDAVVRDGLLVPAVEAEDAVRFGSDTPALEVGERRAPGLSRPDMLRPALRAQLPGLTLGGAHGYFVLMASEPLKLATAVRGIRVSTPKGIPSAGLRESWGGAPAECFGAACASEAGFVNRLEQDRYSRPRLRRL